MKETGGGIHISYNIIFVLPQAGLQDKDIPLSCWAVLLNWRGMWGWPLHPCRHPLSSSVMLPEPSAGLGPQLLALIQLVLKEGTRKTSDLFYISLRVASALPSNRNGVSSLADSGIS